MSSPPKNPFAASTTTTSTNLPSQSSQRVTIPHIPELFQAEYLDSLLAHTTPSTAPKEAAPSHAFTDALKNEANLTRTDNNAAAFVSTESKTLDAFGTLDNNVTAKQVHDLLRESWGEDPATTLRIIWNLRSIHDGKSSKIGFYRAFGWLYKNHPKTAIGNLSLLVDQVIERKPKEKKQDKDPKKSDEVMDEEWTDVAKESSEPLPGFSHGYYKDLLNILSLAMTNQLTNPDITTFTALEAPRPENSKLNGIKAAKRRKARQAEKASERERDGKDAVAKRTAEKVKAEQAAASAKATVDRIKAAEDVHKKLIEKLAKDKNFRALYVAVARIFAKSLAADVKTLHRIADPSTSDAERTVLKWKMTMAAKWAPSLDCAHDRITNIGTAIALVMYASGDFEGLTKQIRIDSEVGVADAQVLRGFYRRWIVSPLRRFVQVTEAKMSANEWKQVNYSRVPSLCFDRNKTHFFKHDEPRLLSYLQDVASGKKSISGATLLPHELLREAMMIEATGKADPIASKLSESNMQVVNAQWNALLDRMREAGTLDNCIAVCDVSGSMGSLYANPKTEGKKKSQSAYVAPIFPSVALSLLLARLAKPPFQNSFITFSHEPSIVTLSGAPDAKFIDLVHEVQDADAGTNTDFNAVFLELLLPMAIKHGLKKEDMVKRLFVFSDMQFDEANAPETIWTSEGPKTPDNIPWETNHQQITKAFNEAGYDMPEIVYWNLAGRVAAKPATKDTPGVSMLSGFSGNLLKIFMDGDEVLEQAEEEEFEEIDEKGEVKEKAMDAKPGMTPLDVMKKALGKKSFDGLRVWD